MNVPNVIFKTRVRDGSITPKRDGSIGGENPYRWQDVTTDEIFKGKKVVVFALPGAFTPTCTTAHLPGYEKAYDEFKKLGIDEVYCLSVNDAFVMNAWGKHLNIKNVKLIPDGSGEFTRGMDMMVAKDNLGFGARSWRYSMYVEDGEIKKIFEEPGKSDNYPDDPFEISDAETMLEYLRMKP